MSLELLWGSKAARASGGLFPRVLTGCVVFLIGISSGLAHPDLMEQISRTTARIEKEPLNADLYLHRADLQRRHSEFEAARQDLARAEKLGAGAARTRALEAQILFDEGHEQKAIMAADQSLQIEPRQPGLLMLRGRWLGRSGRSGEAIADFSRAIRYDPKPSPDLLLERAQLQAELGDLNGAIVGLDEGLRLLGAIPSLELAAIEYERRQRHFEEALDRLSAMIQRYPVKEPWLALRGEVLEQAGNFSEAEAAFTEVVDGLAKYPAHRRGVALNRQLEERARAGLKRLSGRRVAQSVSAAK